MTGSDLDAIGRDVSKALTCAHVRNGSIYVATMVRYPNGTGVTVRVDRGKDGFSVSDDGYAEVIAEDMGAVHALHRVAASVAARAGAKYEAGFFSIDGVEKNLLHIAISTIANVSARAMERTIASLEQPRLKRSREVFDRRLKEAFGDYVFFDLDFKGHTGKVWEFSAGVSKRGVVERLFELVSPSTNAVGLANMKISDVRLMSDPPSVTAALIDYDKTEPALRSILSNAGGMVIAASDDVQKYQLLH